MRALTKYHRNSIIAAIVTLISARCIRSVLERSLGYWARYFFIGMLLLVCWLMPAKAQETDINNKTTAQETPIHIKANQLITDTQQNTAKFNGNVQVTQGDTAITADMLTVYYRDGAQADTTAGMDSIVRIVAEGNVQIVFEEQRAYTQHADYIAEKRVMILTGAGSKIISGKNAISGQKITLHRDDGRVQVVGSADAPVEAFFYSNETGLARPAKPDPN